MPRSLVPPGMLLFLTSPGIPLDHIHYATSFDVGLEVFWVVVNLHHRTYQGLLMAAWMHVI